MIVGTYPPAKNTLPPAVVAAAPERATLREAVDQLPDVES